MEELQPKSQTSDMETRPSDSTMHENIGTGVQTNGSRCSGLMSQKLKYLAVEEGSLFAERAGERYNNECLQATVKHGGGSLQVWGCISANGVGDLVRINGILNAEKYRQILIHHAIPSGRRMMGTKFILQQDNDPKHTANVIKNYLQRKEEQEVLEVKVWPPQSPDLNIIESV